ncbi:hypothetical protein C8F04DRAFT_1193411 [Mycena alexandri]|uniref:Uncharacterized protein n=1 Tax=Mycena alexandri TaxID=1745969 RepID=A0AAD6WU09_9AGAR|nr:hypothetical protein C8F04DRAFT_1193411 [Mycena alexandri]
MHSSAASDGHNASIAHTNPHVVRRVGPDSAESTDRSLSHRFLAPPPFPRRSAAHPRALAARVFPGQDIVLCYWNGMYLSPSSWYGFLLFNSSIFPIPHIGRLPPHFGMTIRVCLAQNVRSDLLGRVPSKRERRTRPVRATASSPWVCTAGIVPEAEADAAHPVAREHFGFTGNFGRFSAHPPSFNDDILLGSRRNWETHLNLGGVLPRLNFYDVPVNSANSCPALEVIPESTWECACGVDAHEIIPGLMEDSGDKR